jgi:serine/threonine protein kinase
VNIPPHGQPPGCGAPSLHAGEQSLRSGLASVNKPTVPDYDLLRRIGAGAYGEIWLARSTATGALRAAKIVWRHSFDSDRPFQREFEGIQKFERISREHPSQLALFHIGRNEAEGYFYYIMELADAVENPKLETRNPNNETTDSGGQLRDSGFGVPWDFGLRASDFYVPHTLRAALVDGRLPAAHVMEIGLALSEALRHLHTHGLVHRDVKPSNVIFVNGKPKLADIGLVTEASDTCSIVGTEGYLPPEGPGTPQGDIFALGKVLYEALTGLDRRNLPQLPKDLRDWPDAKLVFELNAILLKACASHVPQRYQSAEEMGGELMLLRKGQSVRRLHLWKQRIHFLRRMGLAAAAVALLTGGGSLLRKWMERNSVPLSARMSAESISGTGIYEAAQAYNSGLTAMRRGTPQGFRQALEKFTISTKADPKFVAAHARLFEIYLMSEDYDMHNAPPAKAAQLNKFAAHLTKLAPTNAETHAALAIVYFLNEWKWKEAEDEFKHALKTDPNCPMALTYYGYLLTRQLRAGEARTVLKRALRNDPDSPLITKFLGHCDYVEGKYDDALRLYRETSQKEPSYPSGHYWAGRVSLILSNYDQALDDFETHELKQGLVPSQTQKGYKERRAALHRQPEQARGYWLECLEKINDSKAVTPYWYAECHARLGHRVEALAGLKEAVNQRDTVEDVLVDEFWKDYYKEPEFREALKRTGLLRWVP